MSDPNETEVYLSAAHIREWKADYEAALTERSVLAGQLIKLQQNQQAVVERIQSLANKLRAAIPFAPELSEWLEEQDFNRSAENLALPDAILKVMVRIFPANAHVPGHQIHQHLPQVGYPPQKLQATPNYLGIALKRLVARGLLQEAQKGQYGLTQPGRVHAQQLR
jgi:hypothetical protein